MRFIGYGILVVLLMSGCVRRVRHIPIESIEPIKPNRTVKKANTNAKKHYKKVMYTQRAEAKYNLKPEPYSLDSNKTDPELLGPQTTIDRSVIKKPTIVKAEEKVQPSAIQKPQESVAQATTPTPIPKPVAQPASSMTKDQCISMIGNEKFERYSKRFGGEGGAIKRCAILKRLGRG